MSTEFVMNEKGTEKFEVFELAKLMNNKVKLIDGIFDKKFPLVCGAGLRIKGKINLEKLEKTINKAYASIDTMRAVLNIEDENDLHFKIRENYEYKLNVLIPEGNDAEEKYNNAKKEVQYKVFQRETYADCACVFMMYNLGENDNFFVVATEHGIMDGQAMLLIIKKVLLDYIGLPGTGRINKKSLVDFYNFYEDFKDNGVMEANTAYWNNIAVGLEDLFKYNEPLENNTITEEEKLIKVSIQLLKQASKNYRTTIGNIVIAAYQMAIAKTYGTRESAISCISANRTIPDFFDTVVLQLEPMLLRNEIPNDNTEVKEVLKRIMFTTSEGMKHTPSFYSNITYSRFLFSYAQDIMKGMDLTKMQGVDITTWMPDSIPEHVFDVNYIFLIGFEQKKELELHFAVCDKVFCKADFLSITQGMVEIFNRMASEKDLTMEQLLK